MTRRYNALAARVRRLERRVFADTPFGAPYDTDSDVGYPVYFLGDADSGSTDGDAGKGGTLFTEREEYPDLTVVTAQQHDTEDEELGSVCGPKAEEYPDRIMDTAQQRTAGVGFDSVLGAVRAEYPDSMDTAQQHAESVGFDSVLDAVRELYPDRIMDHAQGHYTDGAELIHVVDVVRRELVGGDDLDGGGGGAWRFRQRGKGVGSGGDAGTGCTPHAERRDEDPDRVLAGAQQHFTEGAELDSVFDEVRIEDLNLVRIRDTAQQHTEAAQHDSVLDAMCAEYLDAVREHPESARVVGTAHGHYTEGAERIHFGSDVVRTEPVGGDDLECGGGAALERPRRRGKGVGAGATPRADRREEFPGRAMETAQQHAEGAEFADSVLDAVRGQYPDPVRDTEQQHTEGVEFADSVLDVVREYPYRTRDTKHLDLEGGGARAGGTLLLEGREAHPDRIRETRETAQQHSTAGAELDSVLDFTREEYPDRIRETRETAQQHSTAGAEFDSVLDFTREEYPDRIRGTAQHTEGVEFLDSVVNAVREDHPGRIMDTAPRHLTEGAERIDSVLDMVRARGGGLEGGSSASAAEGLLGELDALQAQFQALGARWAGRCCPHSRGPGTDDALAQLDAQQAALHALRARWTSWCAGDSA